jgi:thermostable 8-oxoguanine DNA glycosylase
MEKINTNEFNSFLKEIKSKIYNAKSKAILSANRLMIELYHEIGKEIVKKQEQENLIQKHHIQEKVNG